MGRTGRWGLGWVGSCLRRNDVRATEMTGGGRNDGGCVVTEGGGARGSCLRRNDGGCVVTEGGGARRFLPAQE